MFGCPVDVQSGMVAVPCKLSNADPGHVRLGELLECGCGGWDLHFSDNDQSSLSQLESI